MTNTEKLIEYRTVNYSSASEAATYITNQQAAVELCFSNPIMVRMQSGRKIMRVNHSAPFNFLRGECMMVPAGMPLAITFPDASLHNPAECICVEVQRDKIDNIVENINRARFRHDKSGEVDIDWKQFVVFSGDHAFDHQLSQLMSLFAETDSEFRDLLIDTKLDELVTRLLQSQSRRLLIERRGNVASNGINAAAEHMIAAPNTRFSTETLAQIACMSVSSFFRHFRARFGVTPTHFANQARIGQAKKALMQNDASISALSQELGFVNSSHFVRVFRQIAGETPGDFQKRQRLDAAAKTDFDILMQ